jgi:hypothetical protein
LKFDPSREALEKDLVDRGTRYLELTKLPYAHRLLVGTTLDEPAEEVLPPIKVPTRKITLLLYRLMLR